MASTDEEIDALFAQQGASKSAAPKIVDADAAADAMFLQHGKGGGGGASALASDDNEDPLIAPTFRKLSRFLGSMGAGFNQELSAVLGLPGDVTNMLFSLAGAKNLHAKGSKEIEAIFDAFPVTRTAGPEDSDLASNIGKMLGYVPAVGAPVILAGSRLLRAGTGAAPRLIADNAGIARRTLEGARGAGRELAVRAAEAPGRTMAAESAAAVGAGAGETGAERVAPGSPIASISGNIAGGFAPGLVIGAGQAAVRALPGGARSNTERRVAEFLQERAGDDKSRAAEKLRGSVDEFDADLTPAQISGSTGLLRLERSLSKGSAPLGDQIIERRQGTDAALTQAIDETEPGAATREVVDQFFDGRIDQINRMVEARINQAAAIARQAADEIPPEIRGDQAQRLAREELEMAYRDAGDAENKFWGAIDKDLPTRTTRLKGAVSAIEARFDPAVQDPADLPSEVIARIKDLEGAEGLGRMMDLRSRVLADIRKARAGDTPNRRLVSHLESIQEAILEDVGATHAVEARLESVAGGGPVRPALKEAGKIRAALAFSRELNDKFRRGPVGKLLGYERTGGLRTPDELTLQKILQPGFMGLRNAKSIIEAAGGTEKMHGLMENFLRDTYTTSVSDPGATTINQAAHNRFMKRHAELLDDFPVLKRQLGNAAEANAMLAARRVQGERTKGLLEKSRAKLWLEAADPQLALARVLNTPTRVTRGAKNVRQINQAEAAKNLMRSAERDPSGMASDGIRRELLTVMLQQVRRGILNPVTGERALSPMRLRAFLKQRGPALSAILKPDQNARLHRILTEAEKVNRAITVTTGGGSDTFENASVMTNVLARVLGARAGSIVAAGTGAGAIVAAGVGSKAALRFVHSLDSGQATALIEQALLDKKVMIDLLEIPLKQKRPEELIRRLRSHLVAAGLPTADQDQP